MCFFFSLSLILFFIERQAEANEINRSSAIVTHAHTNSSFRNFIQTKQQVKLKINLALYDIFVLKCQVFWVCMWVWLCSWKKMHCAFFPSLQWRSSKNSEYWPLLFVCLYANYDIYQIESQCLLDVERKKICTFCRLNDKFARKRRNIRDRSRYAFDMKKKVCALNYMTIPVYFIDVECNKEMVW